MWRTEIDAAIAGNRDRWIATGDPALVAEYRARAFGIHEVLQRTLRDPRMGEVWPQFATGEMADLVFAAVIVRAWMGPWGEQRWTKVGRARWARKVQALATRLAQQLIGTGADELLRKAYGTPALDPGPLSDLLRSLARLAPQLLAPQILDRPHGREARRAYFVRVLTAHCRAWLRGPRRRIVATVAAVALEDDALGERQVQRLAP